VTGDGHGRDEIAADQWSTAHGLRHATHLMLQFEHHLAARCRTEHAPLVAHCHLGLGKLYHRTGKREQAQEHLATATTMYGEMGMTYWLEKAEAEVTNLGR
jgi:hypothetical protein